MNTKELDPHIADKADVSALEREVDELVYALYSLMPEEIKMLRRRQNEGSN